LKALVILPPVVVILALITLFIFPPSPPFMLEDWKKEQIVIGSPKAPVEILLFEDLLCEECQNFTLHILPLILKEFVDTGLARLIYAPIAILDHPEKAISTCYCLFRQDPKKTLLFLERLFEDPDNMQPVDAIFDPFIKIVLKILIQSPILKKTLQRLNR